VHARDVFICDYARTPIGRYGGALAKVRTDDLAAVPIRELVRRHPGIAEAVEEVFYGCANQAGEDNRNVARMATLLAACPSARRPPPSTGSAPRGSMPSGRRRARSRRGRSISPSPAASSR
jgi:hypothetical protein